MDVRVVLYRRLSAKELMLLNCGAGKDSWESLEVQGDPTSQFNKKSILNIHWRDWCWGWSSNTLAIWCEENLMLGKSEVRKKRGWQWKRWLDGIIKHSHSLLTFICSFLNINENRFKEKMNIPKAAISQYHNPFSFFLSVSFCFVLVLFVVFCFLFFSFLNCCTLRRKEHVTNLIPSFALFSSLRKTNWEEKKRKSRTKRRKTLFKS